ncbi:hypothetical protein [Streptomyces sp. NBC_00582]|uniref:hypothetical protein n=1 Tax=Streptomyces sp. NBC_00582 TaxID=2975783 RepID=UPI002E80DD76|nr:hypothetical protein [Streptomyces sp. NBC_00582]WUB64643.1 hypothetical protein OG852_31695 [Streptomyces sp. NBC_00582]
MTRPPSSRDGARRVRCRCGRTVLRQLVGNRAALDVTADADQLTSAAAARLREPNRLDWCVRTSAGGLDLQWADCHRRKAECTRPHVIDHQCTGDPAALAHGRGRGRRPRKTSVPEGQLALG